MADRADMADMADRTDMAVWADTAYWADRAGKSEIMSDSLTHSLTAPTARRCYRI